MNFKLNITLGVLLSMILISSKSPDTTGQYISGKISAKDPDIILQNSYVFVHCNKRHITKARVDRNGRYQLSFSRGSDDLKYDFYWRSVDFDTVYLKSYEIFSSQQLKWDIVLD